MVNLDHFIEQIDFEINQFNVGDRLYQYLIVLHKYKSWFEYYCDEKRIQVKTDDIILVFEKLLAESASSHLKKQLQAIKESSDTVFPLHPESLFKIYLILKVRLHQVGDQHVDLHLFYQKLQDYFERLEDTSVDSFEQVVTRELPEIKENSNSNQVFLPLSISILAMTGLNFLPATNVRLFIQILMFIIAGIWIFNIQKQQKTKRDEPYLKKLDIVFSQPFQ